MKSLIPSKIKAAKIKKTILALLAIFALIALNFSNGQNIKHIKAGVSVSGDGNTVSFGSGYFSVDSSGYVYQKEGSNIADTPDYIYPYVSYLSAHSLDAFSNYINIANKNVVVGSGATVLMENSQTLLSLTVNSGGVVSQPQPDREGKINRYQYSDQEWGLIIYGFLKVGNGEQRKLTCSTSYYIDPTNTEGNGCVISYSPTYDGSASIFDLADWDVFDEVWQTGTGSFDTFRYTEVTAPYIDNTTGSDQYYPIRMKFKNDHRDNRLEPMQAILRNHATGDSVVGSADGVADSLLFGVDDNGKYDTSGHVYMAYYLADEYLPTPANPDLGWISEDFSNAYQTYPNPDLAVDHYENYNIALSSDLNGYGKHTAGIFYLEYDDQNAYTASAAVTPFSKGSSGAVYDPEVYKTFTASNKTVNANLANSGQGPSGRYISAGLTLTVSGEMEMAGGYIDVSGKGYAGYNMELRTENDDATLLTVRGGGDSSVSGLSGGLSSNNIPQGAAHAKTASGGVSGAGGADLYQDGSTHGKNENVYGDKITPTTLGSGGGGASQDDAIPSRGGNGGGYVSVRAGSVRFSPTNLSLPSTAGAIMANGSSGYQIAGGWNRASGGSGGTVSIITTNLYYPNTTASTKYLESKGGGGILVNSANTTYSSGGGGGYIKVVTSSFYSNGVLTITKNKIWSSTDVAGGCGEGAQQYYGGPGQVWVDFQPQVDISFPGDNITKKVTIDRFKDSQRNSNDRQVFPDDTVNVNLSVKGMIDTSARRPENVDIVIVSDTSKSMNESVGGDTKINWLRNALGEIFDSAYTVNSNEPQQINLGLVNFHSIRQEIASANDLGGCEVDQFNPYGTTCSFSYDSSNYMTTSESIFVGDYKSYINGPEYNPYGGTSMGAGLNNAINHLLGSDSRADARKFIIMVSDGQENLPTCTTGATDTYYKNYFPLLRPTLYPACQDSITRFTTGYVDGTTKPQANYPLDRIAKNHIGLITIQTTDDSIDSTNADFLSNISKYSFENAPAFDGQQYYGLADISMLEDAFQSTLYNIISTQMAMQFEVKETLPLGAKLAIGDEEPKLIVNDGDKSKSINPIVENDIDGRIVIRWRVTENDYLDGIDFDKQLFKTNIKFVPEDIPSGSNQDVDQNKECPSLDNVDAMQIIDSEGKVVTRSSVQYNPAGNYSTVDTNPIPFPTECYQFFSNMVAGDVYTKDGYLKNFAFYGNDLNLYNRDPGYGSMWNIPNYVFNPQAQSSFSDEQKNEYLRKITLYKNEAQSASANQLNYPTYQLQGKRNLADPTDQEASMPEGKIWQVNPSGSGNSVTIATGAHKYEGKGTIIINGNLKIEKNANIDPVDKSSDILGIIVLGNLEVGGDNQITAPIFVLNDFTIANKNVKMTGSFIANKFNIASDLTRVRLYYYDNLDRFWPPGFRLFNMPTAKNSAQ